MTKPAKKQGFFKRNADNFKVGGICAISISGIATIVASIVLHLINPALGVITVPICIQALLSVLIRKAPHSVMKLKSKVQEILKDEDQETVSQFVDEIVTKYDTSSRYSISNPSNSTREVVTNEPIQMNAYYYPSRDEYQVTPRPPERQTRK
jgi:type III secretory pathway component EscR